MTNAKVTELGLREPNGELDARPLSIAETAQIRRAFDETGARRRLATWDETRPRALRGVPTLEPLPVPDPAFHRGLCVGVAVSLVFWVGFAVAWWLS